MRAVWVVQASGPGFLHRSGHVDGHVTIAHG